MSSYAFHVSAPKEWNWLPLSFCSSNSLPPLIKQLIAHYFSLAFKDLNNLCVTDDIRYPSVCRPQYTWALWLDKAHRISRCPRSLLIPCTCYNLRLRNFWACDCNFTSNDAILKYRNTSTTLLGSSRLRWWQCTMHISTAFVVLLRTRCTKSVMASTSCWRPFSVIQTTLSATTSSNYCTGQTQKQVCSVNIVLVETAVLHVYIFRLL